MLYKKYLDVKKLFGCGMRNDKSDLLSLCAENLTEIENRECIINKKPKCLYY